MDRVGGTVLGNLLAFLAVCSYLLAVWCPVLYVCCNLRYASNKGAKQDKPSGARGTLYLMYCCLYGYRHTCLATTSHATSNKGTRRTAQRKPTTTATGNPEQKQARSDLTKTRPDPTPRKHTRQRRKPQRAPTRGYAASNLPFKCTCGTRLYLPLHLTNGRHSPILKEKRNKNDHNSPPRSNSPRNRVINPCLGIKYWL